MNNNKDEEKDWEDTALLKKKKKKLNEINLNEIPEILVNLEKDSRWIEIQEKLKEKKLQMIETIKKTNDPMVSAPYFSSEETLVKFKKFIQDSLGLISSQNSYLVGLLQATLSGKTRLLKELGLTDFVIIIAFKDTTMDFLHNIVNENNKYCDNFEDQLIENRSIMLKIRLFYLSYLYFAQIFLKICNKKTWVSADKEERECFLMMLLNGGGDLIKIIFKFLVSYFFVFLQQPKTMKLKLLDNLKILVCFQFDRIIRDIGKPFFAIDECHMPADYCRGLLFHSDYKDHDQELVFKWHQYERATSKTIPEGYPYKQPTTLFTAFRYLANEFLTQKHIMTILTSTQYSCMRDLVEKNSYSQKIIQIRTFSDLPRFNSFQDIKKLFKLYFKQEYPVEIEKYESYFDWCYGRTGLFMKYFWLHFSKQTSISQIPTLLKIAEEEARKCVDSWIGQISFQSNLRVQKIDQKELLEYLHYRNILFNGVILDENKTDILVNAGLAIKNLGTGGVCCEPLVKKVIQFSGRFSLKDVSEVMIKEFSENHAKMAERAIALQIFEANQKTLNSLLESWGQKIISKKLQSFLSGCKIDLENVGTMDEFQVVDASDIFAEISPLWKKSLILARDGISTPDIFFFCDNQYLDGGCFVSIQIKHWDSRILNLPKEKKETNNNNNNSQQKEKTKAIYFPDVLKNVTIQHFLSGTLYQQELALKNWKTHFLNQGQPLHLRIIINWSGFTQAQYYYEQEWNKENPLQPVFLLPKEVQSAKRIYGDQVYKAFCSKLGEKIPQSFEPGTSIKDRIKKQFFASSQLGNEFCLSDEQKNEIDELGE